MKFQNKLILFLVSIIATNIVAMEKEKKESHRPAFTHKIKRFFSNDEWLVAIDQELQKISENLAHSKNKDSAKTRQHRSKADRQHRRKAELNAIKALLHQSDTTESATTAIASDYQLWLDHIKAERDWLTYRLSSPIKIPENKDSIRVRKKRLAELEKITVLLQKKKYSSLPGVQNYINILKVRNPKKYFEDLKKQFEAKRSEIGILSTQEDRKRHRSESPEEESTESSASKRPRTEGRELYKSSSSTVSCSSSSSSSSHKSKNKVSSNAASSAKKDQPSDSDSEWLVAIDQELQIISEKLAHPKYKDSAQTRLHSRKAEFNAIKALLHQSDTTESATSAITSDYQLWLDRIKAERDWLIYRESSSIKIPENKNSTRMRKKRLAELEKITVLLQKKKLSSLPEVQNYINILNSLTKRNPKKYFKDLKKQFEAKRSEIGISSTQEDRKRHRSESPEEESTESSASKRPRTEGRELYKSSNSTVSCSSSSCSSTLVDNDDKKNEYTLSIHGQITKFNAALLKHSKLIQTIINQDPQAGLKDPIVLNLIPTSISAKAIGEVLSILNNSKHSAYGTTELRTYLSNKDLFEYLNVAHYLDIPQLSVACFRNIAERFAENPNDLTFISKINNLSDDLQKKSLLFTIKSHGIIHDLLSLCFPEQGIGHKARHDITLEWKKDHRMAQSISIDTLITIRDTAQKQRFINLLTVKCISKLLNISNYTDGILIRGLIHTIKSQLPTNRLILTQTDSVTFFQLPHEVQDAVKAKFTDYFIIRPAVPVLNLNFKTMQRKS